VIHDHDDHCPDSVLAGVESVDDVLLSVLDVPLSVVLDVPLAVVLLDSSVLDVPLAVVLLDSSVLDVPSEDVGTSVVDSVPLSVALDVSLAVVLLDSSVLDVPLSLLVPLDEDSSGGTVSSCGRCRNSSAWIVPSSRHNRMIST
jgi:hypothetical protein